MCEPKQWTLMFYFATDNPLAISAISQLKAIKDAGFHPDANVVAQFDPYTEGTPTHVFDVNVVNKLKEHGKSNIGFRGNDPAVRSLIEDKLWRDEQTSSLPPVGAGATTSNFESVRNALHRVLDARYHINYKPPVAPNVSSTFNPLNDQMEEPGAETSLREFLRFCADKYPAKHYMLFMLGHGVVVGNDVFMLDEHATEQTLTLTSLGKILAEFKHSIELEGSAFDLVSFHSCSVSSLEVAYELQGTAKYMLASQGPAFVGSWPYRQILVRIFNSLPDRSTAPGKNEPLPEIKDAEMRELMFQIYRSCMLNSADYLLAGYSFQLTLCDLEKVSSVKTAIETLAAALKDGIEKDEVTKKFKDPISADFILLSHWKSQSFFNEMYSDLYDFCFCLSNKIHDLRKSGTNPNPLQLRIEAACIEVMKMLVKENPKNTARGDKKQFIVAADSLGPAFQYSRGLSVYFPWSEPSKDSPVLAQYQRYRFSTDTKNAWLEFLRKYFDNTKRDVSSKEPDPMRFLPLLPTNGTPPIDLGLEEDIASLIYNGEGTPDLSGALVGLKSDPTDRTGGDISFISIKNFPRDIRARGERRQQGDSSFPITEAFGLIEPNGKISQNGKTSPNRQNGQKNGSSSEAVVVSPKPLG